MLKTADIWRLYHLLIGHTEDLKLVGAKMVVSKI